MSEASFQHGALAALRHDMRTTINQILGYSELLEEEAADSNVPSIVSDLKKIQGSARALLGLINANLTEEGFASIARGTASDSPDDLRRSGNGSKNADPQEHDEPGDAPAPITGRILAVDDMPGNLDLLARRLERQGHTVVCAGNGDEALKALRESCFDLVLLDVIMPLSDGYAALCKMKEDADLRHVPVIMISALDEIGSVVRCIEAGAEDYLPKPFDPTLLRARIGASLEKKMLRDHEQRYLHTIEETQRRLSAELNEAANYVRSIFPEPVNEPLRIEWRYVPSTELGGDAFGYHWLDDDRLAIYLLDVCGHGVGASLLSVAAINVLRACSLPNVDFCDPTQVLGGLNEAFQMDRQNNMYFTIWYGVFNRADRTIRFSSGGHPPAVLLQPAAADPPSLHPLSAQNLMIGAMPEVRFRSACAEAPAGSRLFLFSDGAYEIKGADGCITSLSDFEQAIRRHGLADNPLDRLLEWARDLHGEGPFDDDVSILFVAFP